MRCTTTHFDFPFRLILMLALAAALCPAADANARVVQAYSLAAPTSAETRLRVDHETLGADFQYMQFLSDASRTYHQTEPVGLYGTHFVYTSNLNGFAIPVGIRLVDGLFATATIPYLQRSFTVEGVRMRAQGLGDISTGLKYGLSLGPLDLQGNGYVKLPTGDAGAEDFDFTIPLGTGSTDYGAAAQAGLRPAHWLRLEAGAGWRGNGVGESHSFPQALRVKQGNVRTLTGGLTLMPIPELHLSAKWSQRRIESGTIYLSDGIATELEGMDRVDFVPEVRWHFYRMSVAVMAVLPQQVSGTSGADELDANPIFDVVVMGTF